MQGVLPKLEDFNPQTIGPFSGAHGQQIIDALRKLDEKDGHDSAQPHPYWDFQEVFPATVVALNHELNGSQVGDVIPSMYWVRKCFIQGGATAEPLVLPPATDDQTQWYPATNILELGLQTSNVGIGQPVLVYAYVDRGIANRKRYIFVADRPVLWMKITSAMAPYIAGPPPLGSGGWYNARSVAKAPVTLDPITNLVAPISPNEEVASTDDILACNWYEANLGNPPTHVVQCPTFAPGWLIGYSDETVPRPVYRFYVPRPGSVPLQLASGYTTATASGRYYGRVMLGAVAGQTLAVLDALQWQGQDNGTLFPPFPAPLVMWCNFKEAGSGSIAPPNSTFLMAGSRWVMGTFEGVTSDGVAVYYGDSLSYETFTIKITSVSGTGGDYTTPASYLYDCLLMDGVGGFGSGLAPLVGRGAGAPVGPFQPGAGYGLGYLDANGTPGLFCAFEQPAPAWKVADGTYVISASLGGGFILAGGSITSYTPAL